MTEGIIQPGDESVVFHRPQLEGFTCEVQPTLLARLDALVEPSNDEQSQWSEATEAYVRGLEAIALQAAQDNERLREEVAKLYCAGGCSCCRDDTAWDAASEALGQLLAVPLYADDSGRDWYSVTEASRQ